MSNIVRTNKEINVAEGDFAKKLREALGQDEERGTEIALRREFEAGVATTMVVDPDKIFKDNPLGNGIAWETAQPAITFDATLFGKSVV